MDMKQFLQFVRVMPLVFFILSAGSAEAQLSGTPENIMGSFTYNFTEYITWPEQGNSDNFRIVVLGSSDIVKTLQYIASVRKVDEKNIEIVVAKGVGDIKTCQMLFVASEFTHLLPQLDTHSELKHTVIITQCAGCLQKGASINFISEDERIRFEINKTRLEQKKIKTSSQLLKLAVNVI